MYKYILLALVFLSGCTASLWATNYKKESLNGFYVKSDTKELFVTTTKTAYLLGIDAQFGEALELSREVEFIPTFEDFRLDEKNNVVGSVTLTMKEKSPPQELVVKLISLGFEQQLSSNQLKLKRELTGKRYIIEGELPLEKLEKEYIIMVAQPRTFSETAGKVIATPATITIDAVVTVPAVFFAAAVMAAGSP
ncbi:hypothetical protein [Pseudoalteromonas luteoviolacea]|uniref:Lipid/polyisoprenoid-binding YceI-like domain-containing protein n=1 Tax=Pseudoalteromonas luteoviolacea NCIMB 1942 TaxID=1365253 RepID=A0A167DHD6_9GAMM|nr:hypothetical protein [Pseudoalteromonas luteoviolacea]KZN48842.1 hypothetical protein N482_06825 [Pseudoalteromonas luteoviolacea NCIMB 1942]KZW99791.1 hypothetical protein JL49_15695 [Pseudoalteromonas luteoviolacea]